MICVLRAVPLRKEYVDRLAQHFGCAVAKRLFGRVIKQKNIPACIRANYGIRNELKDIDSRNCGLIDSENR